MLTRTATGPAMPLALALALALAAFFALAALASAAPIATYPSGGITPASFGKACLDTNGILTQYRQADGTITKSTCYHNTKKSSECDWIKKTCTDFFVTAPTTGVEGFPAGGALEGGAARANPDWGGVATLDDEP